MADNVYEACADVLSLFQSMQDDLAAILDPETGFAPQLRAICRNLIAEYEEQTPDHVAGSILDLLRLEENTWGLLQAVMPARKTEFPQFDSARDLLQENPYTPTSTVAQAIMNASPLLSELIVIREWLQETAPAPQHPEATTGYWTFTKHNVVQAARTAAGARGGLVKELDPDALNRGDGRALASDDANFEKNLTQALYSFVRAGRLEEAIELCRKAHQPWRAASIRGSRLFQWRLLCKNSLAGDESDEDDPDMWIGNRNRRLWKTTCTRAALNTNLPEHERVLYAALAPSPQTFGVLKSACRTWEDYLWAHVSIMCEEKESMEMNKLGGCFWEGGKTAVEKGVAVISEDKQEEEEEEWQKEVCQVLEGLRTVPVEDGPSAGHPLHFSQLHIILDRTSVLLTTFSDGLKQGLYQRSSLEYAPMCRFFAHLCLFLQMIEIAVPPAAVQTILEAYLQVLEAAGQRDLIAMYAGALGDNAINRYAVFLVSLDLTADPAERRQALTRAREHGLDVDRVAVATAEQTIVKAFDLLPLVRGSLPSLATLQTSPTDAQLLLLRSIEWTTFMESTYDTALEQANVILRYFLASGRVQVAQQLLGMLPLDLASISEPEEQATEYLYYRQFFVIWEALERVVEIQAMEVLQMSKDSRNDWLVDYKSSIDQAKFLIMKLLTSEWLVSENDLSNVDQRKKDLIRIRQIYIPELIIRLHYLLFNSRQLFPENMRQTLELVNIVADSRYKLYSDFVNEDGRRLGDYLATVRQGVLGGLEGGGSDPFRVLMN
ncbi:nuclear pore protein 84/107 [Guyanagaster necrorhizus]|uniref:Nuclear pore complex protein n=1 Tax=Guyanagaster necrorhizus TaxID=856835 RepID=A0A9P7VR01_9AGAR|nr:nuclear pore protein 84/107 [Guyanagaster necrorhizus MCA 3950]KAG7444855.1 nuclear pore protein 84/107 [Guyanagaster necrorhizus MCA 3950]